MGAYDKKINKYLYKLINNNELKSETYRYLNNAIWVIIIKDKYLSVFS